MELRCECEVAEDEVEYPPSANELNDTTEEGGSDAESLDILRRLLVRGLKLRSGS